MVLPWPFIHTPSVTLGTSGPPVIGRPVVLKGTELAAHKHILGVTGQGKSKAIASLFLQLLNQGIGALLIDPHADLADDVLASLASNGFFRDPRAYDRLLYLDLTRQDRFLPFNVLAAPYPPHQLASQINEVFKRVWPALADGAAPQFENILLSAVLVLIENRRPITALPRLLTDKPYRDGLLQHVSDPQVVSFFHDRYDRWGREAPLMIESTLRRIFLLTFSPSLRYALGQPTNALNFRDLMDRGISVIVSLGGLDEDTQRLLGSLVSVGVEVAALSRVDIPEPERRPYHLILDEFSMFSAQSEEALSRVLSLARKYALSITLAHQTWSQLSTRLQGALQNALEISFKLGPNDAAWAAPRFARYDPYLVKHEVVDPYQVERTHPLYFSVQEILTGWQQSLMDLQPREAYVKTGGHVTKIRTLKLSPPTCTRAELAAIKERYAERLLTPRAQAAAQVDQQPPATPPPTSRTVFVADPDA